MRLLLAMLCVVLGGCATTNSATSAQFGGTTMSGGAAASMTVVARGTGTLTALVFTLLTIDSVKQYEPKAELDPGRRVQEVDCSQPIAPTAANLRCK